MLLRWKYPVTCDAVENTEFDTVFAEERYTDC